MILEAKLEEFARFIDTTFPPEISPRPQRTSNHRELEQGQSFEGCLAKADLRMPDLSWAMPSPPISPRVQIRFWVQ